MMEETYEKLNERELEDNYPLRAGFLYVVDGKVVRAVADGTPAEWKRRKGCRSVMSCDIAGRNLWHEMV